jgi:lipopolysaccharide export LptBFGC system permease protein LptF
MDAAAPNAEERRPRLTGTPWTLWTYVIWELLRVFAVTAGVIVTVIAFGAAAKPLADNSIGAEVVLKYVTLAMVPMLQFAMPFAAGFAATLVMHRFASDNEVVAMSACGMSHRRIMAPVAILGGGLCVVMFVLVAFVIPNFWTRMKELATSDATQVLVAAVGRGEAVTADRLMIYADSAREVDPPAGSGARRRLLLSGVAAIELASAGSSSVATEFTAEDAAVDIHDTPRGMVAKVALMNATVIRPGEGALVTVPVAEPEAASVYSGFEKGPKFLTIPGILELRRDVDRSLNVQQAKRPVASALGELDLWRCIERMAPSGTLSFTEPGTSRGVRIEGVAVAAGQLSPAPGRDGFRLVETSGGRPVRTATARAATLRAVSEAGFEPRFALVAQATSGARDLASGLPGRWSPRLDDLLPEGCAPTDWMRAPSAEVLEASRAFPEADGAGPFAQASRGLARARSALEMQRADVVWESDSHLANRFAQSVSIVLVLLLGGCLAVAMRQAMPLTVYILAFLPAVANIFMVSGGQLMMSDGLTLAGSAVMWGGNAVLLAAVVATWSRLRRN